MTTGRGVVILGGTAGVGRETGATFAGLGDRVVLVGRNAERGAAAAEWCRVRAPGAAVEFVSADAADPAEAVRAEEEARRLLGAIDVLVCATGPSQPPRLLHRIPIDEVAARLDELVRPPLHMTCAVLPDMRRRGSGSVVNVASDAAKVATPGETVIGAAMAAIVMFSRAAALECKREGVRINVVTPSLIADTPGAAMIAEDPFAGKMFERAAGLAQLGVAEPEDVVALIVFLAGPAARRITGQAVSVNGGISVA